MRDLAPLLAIWAHPDDESFVSSGLMLSILENGGRVVVVHATRGEAGSQDHERWPPDQMGEIRERECKEALRILGVTEHHWLDYIDGECENVSPEEAVAKVEAIMRDVEARTVITFDEKGGTGHPDHVAVNAWTRAAFAASAPEGARLCYYTETPEWAEKWCPIFDAYNVFAPGTPITTPRSELAISIQLDDQMMDRKMKALKAHASQTEAIFNMFGEDQMRASHAEENYSLAAIGGR